MRAAAALFIVAAIGVSVGVFASRTPTATAEGSRTKSALAEITALQQSEAALFAREGRYSDRLADLFSSGRSGTDIVMNAPGLDIELHVSTDGKTLIIRVESDSIALSRVLEDGQEIGQTCVVLEAAEQAGC